MEKIIREIMFEFILVGITFFFAWIPMIAWNYGLHSVFPQIPTVNYIQIWLISLLVSSVFSRPQYHDKD